MKARLNSLISKFIEDSNYQVNPDGSVFRVRDNKKLGYIKETEKKMRNKQYLYIKYKGKELKVHRIVYAKFIGKLEYKMVIHHIDSDGLNNHVNNLEQVTQELNSHYKRS